MGDAQRPPTMREVNGAYVASTAVVVGDVRLAKSANVWHNVVARGDDAAILIGENTNIQDLTMLHAEPGEPLEIADHVTVGHGAIVHGRRIGARTLIGMGSIILGHAEIGADCIIAAGALVTERARIPDGSIVMGVPGKVVKAVPPGRAEAAIAHALYYCEKARAHAAGKYPPV